MRKESEAPHRERRTTQHIEQRETKMDINETHSRLGGSAAASGPRHAVHSIDHYALEVPDLAVAEHFLDAFGLIPQRKGNSLEVFAGDQHFWA